MHHTHLLGVLGLICNTIGAVLLMCFPPLTQLATARGQESLTWAGAASSEGRRRDWLHREGFRVGVALLTLGFLLQLGDLLTA